MSYYTDYIFWLPAKPWSIWNRTGKPFHKGVDECSVSLVVEDGRTCVLSMDDCMAEPNQYDCNCQNTDIYEHPEGLCGYGNFASRKMTKQELLRLKQAIDKALKELK